jgi:hypothetical protein
MGILIRAVISGFGMSLGAALFRKVAKELGLDDKDAKVAETPPEPTATPERGDQDLGRVHA